MVLRKANDNDFVFGINQHNSMCDWIVQDQLPICKFAYYLGIDQMGGIQAVRDVQKGMVEYPSYFYFGFLVRNSLSIYMYRKYFVSLSDSVNFEILGYELLDIEIES